MGYEGLRFFLFRKKERSKEKPIGSFFRGIAGIWDRGTGFFIREAARVCCFKMLTRYESAAFLWYYYLWLTRFGILGVSGYRESGVPI